MLDALRGKTFSRSAIICLSITFAAVLLTSSVVFAADILYVVGKSTIKDSDKAVIKHLEGRGFNVHVKKDIDAQSTDADKKDLVIISESVLAKEINSKFRDVEAPIICSEPWLYDDLGMTGETKFQDFGRRGKQKDISVSADGHPMAAALSGNVQVSSKSSYLGWGIPGDDAIRVACLNDDAEKCVIFGYDTGSKMPGLTAPGKRAGFFMFKNSASNLTAEGWWLFNAVVDWSMGGAEGSLQAQK